MNGRVLVIAGSDSGAGAGIQADLKTVMALGGYATTAITALTAQNTRGVRRIMAVSADFVTDQMMAVLDDIGADSVKTGMLLNAGIVEAVARALATHAAGLPLVVDPVMVATAGTRLLDDDAVAAMRALLFPKTTLLTPNVPEAEVLLGREIADLDAMRLAAAALLGEGPKAVLLKGGHLDGDRVHDVLATRGGITVYSDDRLATRHTHGTGCTLASAIAAGLAGGLELTNAIPRARLFLREAMRRAPGLGQGHGPLDHACRIRA